MSDPLTFVRLGFGEHAVPYERAWDVQREVHAAVTSGALADTCLLLEHPPVYTAGKRTEPLERPADGTPVIDVDRGGKITWHGPGQLVGYPIVSLRDPVDVVGYVRALEQALIDSCAELGLVACGIDGRSGVWFPPDDGRPARKVGAIGIRVAQDVTMHGFALNCACDLTAFDHIVPCGISDAGVTSLAVEAGRSVQVSDMLPAVERHLTAALGYPGLQVRETLPAGVLARPA